MSLVESSQTLKAGSPAPPFSLKGVDGKAYSLSTFDGANALVVVFMCNHCPYVLAKIDELNRLYASYRPRQVGFVGINSNNNPDYPDDSFENMVKFAQEKGIRFPYLFDETQAVAKAYGAACTPDPFLFDSSQRLVYHGRINDAMSPEAQATKHDLDEALDALLRGSLPRTSFLASRGCSIKWRQ